MVIYLATDHAGFSLKESIKEFLNELGHEVTDCGALEYEEEDDYPKYIKLAAKKVKKGGRAIIFGGSGQGEAMVANRQKGVRAAVYYGGDLHIIELSREKNDANVLSLGARFIKKEEAIEAIKLWLETPFGEVERHKRRIKQF